MQPVAAEWNPSGYLWNVIDRVRVYAEVPRPAPPAEANRSPVGETEPGRRVFDNRCLDCHENDLTRQQRLAHSGWVREIDKMVRWGATVTDSEREALLDYLSRQFGPGK
jgi:mono/diheme cytochrome c family protein